MHQFVLQKASVKATLLAGELLALRARETQKLIEGKEVELDGEIVKALTFWAGGYPIVLWPFDGAYEHARYLRSVALYRAVNPPSVWPLPTEQNTL